MAGKAIPVPVIYAGRLSGDSYSGGQGRHNVLIGESGAESSRANASSKSRNCSGFIYDNVAGRAKRQGKKTGQKLILYTYIMALQQGLVW